MAKKILVTWFGSFKNWSTIGDYLSVKVLTEFLQDQQYDFDCACHKDFGGIKGRILSLNSVDPSDYSTLIFCCGPINNKNKKLKGLISDFNDHLKIAVGVSLFPKSNPNYYNPFDFVLARENGEKDYTDLAVLDNPKEISKRKAKHFTVGLVLRNKQEEYGTENCMSTEANRALTEVARILLKQNQSFFVRIKEYFRLQRSIIKIDNQFYNNGATAKEIEQQYQQCDIILTTRFHGAITALRYGIPVMALDQINNGAKVHNLLSKIEFPFVWKINDFDAVEAAKVASGLLQGKYKHEIDLILKNAQAGAERTLHDLESFLNDRISSY
jgi:hypothetical protein